MYCWCMSVILLEVSSHKRVHVTSSSSCMLRWKDWIAVKAQCNLLVFMDRLLFRNRNWTVIAVFVKCSERNTHSNLPDSIVFKDRDWVQSILLHLRVELLQMCWQPWAAVQTWFHWNTSVRNPEIWEDLSKHFTHPWTTDTHTHAHTIQLKKKQRNIKVMPSWWPTFSLWGIKRKYWIINNRRSRPFLPLFQDQILK